MNRFCYSWAEYDFNTFIGLVKIRKPYKLNGERGVTECVNEEGLPLTIVSEDRKQAQQRKNISYANLDWDPQF